MQEITDNYQCPIFAEFRPGSCLRDFQSSSCPLFLRKDGKEWCTYQEYQLKRKTEHGRGYKLKARSHNP